MQTQNKLVSSRRRAAGSVLRTAAIVIVTAIVVAPGTALAVHVFDDVPDDSVHAPGIEWVADNGITAGCGDGSNYCPNDPVTRAQMGTFMHRLSGHADGVVPSVDAATVGGMTAAELMAGDGGVLAAGVRLDDGAIQRSFNTYDDATPTISSAGADSVNIDMGFDVSDKIALCSVDTNVVATRDAICTVSTPGGSTLRVRVYDVSADAMVSNASEVFVTVMG